MHEIYFASYINPDQYALLPCLGGKWYSWYECWQTGLGSKQAALGKACGSHVTRR